MGSRMTACMYSSMDLTVTSSEPRPGIKGQASFSISSFAFTCTGRSHGCTEDQQEHFPPKLAFCIPATTPSQRQSTAAWRSEISRAPSGLEIMVSHKAWYARLSLSILLLLRHKRYWRWTEKNIQRAMKNEAPLGISIGISLTMTRLLMYRATRLIHQKIGGSDMRSSAKSIISPIQQRPNPCIKKNTESPLPSGFLWSMKQNPQITSTMPGRRTQVTSNTSASNHTGRTP
eukprot:05668_1